jgi:hypothetical protein
MMTNLAYKNIFESMEPRFGGPGRLHVSSAGRGKESVALANLWHTSELTQATLINGISKNVEISSIPLVEKLFNKRVDLKIATNYVASHLSTVARSKLFQQLDLMLEDGEWDKNDPLPQVESYKSFLKAFLFIGTSKLPGLGISNIGNIISAWTNGRDRLTIEYLPTNQVKWVLSRYDEIGERESAAGQIDIRRIKAALAPYHPERWFND